MRVDRDEVRQRSAAEVAFIVVRALATARLLWGRDWALPLDALADLVSAPRDTTARVIERLREEGVAQVSAGERTVRITDAASRELFQCLDGMGLVAPGATGGAGDAGGF
jgi:DNA-binding IclR family transcriptional regulator